MRNCIDSFHNYYVNEKESDDTIFHETIATRLFQLAFKIIIIEGVLMHTVWV